VRVRAYRKGKGGGENGIFSSRVCQLIHYLIGKGASVDARSRKSGKVLLIRREGVLDVGPGTQDFLGGKRKRGLGKSRAGLLESVST